MSGARRKSPGKSLKAGRLGIPLASLGVEEGHDGRRGVKAVCIPVLTSPQTLNPKL